MNYDDIEKKDEKTLLILYRAVESNNGKLNKVYERFEKGWNEGLLSGKRP